MTIGQIASQPNTHSSVTTAELRHGLGPYLVESQKLSSGSLERAENITKESGEKLELVLTRLGLMGERELTEALAEFLHLPLLTAREFPEIAVLEDCLSRRFLKEVQILPLADGKDSLAVAAVNPLDTYALEALRFAVGKPVHCSVIYPSDFEIAYERLYGDGKSEIHQLAEGARDQRAAGENEDVERLKDIASEAPVIRLVNLLITRAVEARASDIHIEPMDGDLRVRYRVDGVLHDVESPPSRLSAAVISRVKIMARLNIAERRLAQDGRIRLAVRGKDIDFRVSTAPTIHGESVVLRILDRGSLKLDFYALGFDDTIIARFRQVLDQPHGILLLTGPTGSGKTTTLYTALLELNTPDKKILTIEDPVEYQLKGVNQVQVKPQIGLTFATALRSFLRQDPDIMMVGEIRDVETAQIAIQAALTGHLILSTLHTNDSASAVTRLLDMGVEDYLLTSTINGLAAQRLVRTLCPECREAYEMLPELAERMGINRLSKSQRVTLYRPKGCIQCANTGYLGRSSIIEVLPISDGIRQLILKRADTSELRKAAIEEGMETIRAHGMRKVLAGTTSFDEVVRATRTG